MKMEKVIRIVGTCIGIAAIGIAIAYRLMFPEAPMMRSLPITMGLIIAMICLWKPASKKEQNSNK